MMQLRIFLAFLLGLAAVEGQTADHPSLTHADEAYSAGNYEEAVALYRRDAELGSVAAQVNLAFLYLDGQGTAQDFQQAGLWFLRAAELGDREAQQNIAGLYQAGKGVALDPVEAGKWFIIAGATAEAAAVESQMTAEQVAEARQRAAQWRSKHPQSATTR